ncbi:MULTISPECIES: protein-export chaperone SecB [unclassified Anaerobiospirillum]|uniref:protein-export chaperone SecB n=1 Tax=unclassified Anaerobiospirillum TaxID=2647410 RepID=UPI001FF1A81D|nr:MULTISPECIES: protein-export chaperone SecB [unclassified Anaerobiospirillum]MCK0525436.1 protein-export chaperone SecB [Anaerobiospirillum sp. NML120449]MCK0534149.1 protein-export chaperone SecB [Anaerobiospirillum sp. NML120511]MCK0539307.1 protein-export chaperone SecB [Anaerobiospirillum sp. NML02-A-032]
MSENANEQAQAAATRPLFDLIRVYAKDSSLETPHSPVVFQSQWKPELQVKFDTKTTKIADDQFEVALRITVTCNNEGKTAFICEVTQAGVFLLRNIPGDAGEFLLGGTAPNILFPYAREFIASLVSRATFPQLNLAPINFEALFRARKAQQDAQSGEAAKEEGEDK